MKADLMDINKEICLLFEKGRIPKKKRILNQFNHINILIEETQRSKFKRKIIILKMMNLLT